MVIRIVLLLSCPDICLLCACCDESLTLRGVLKGDNALFDNRGPALYMSRDSFHAGHQDAITTNRFLSASIGLGRFPVNKKTGL